jgi:hypothetical protein
VILKFFWDADAVIPQKTFRLKTCQYLLIFSGTGCLFRLLEASRGNPPMAFVEPLVALVQRWLRPASFCTIA